MESGGEIPPLPFLQNEPSLEEHLEFEWRAFREISRDRQSGFGIGPIPWTTFDRYALRYGIDDVDDFERFCRLMSAMDDAFQSHHAEKQEQSKPK